MHIPLPRLMKPGLTRPAASVYAVCMFATAVRRCAGVGDLYDAARSCPVTWVELADVPSAPRTRVNPVSAVLAAGLMPMFPAVWSSSIVSLD